MSEENKNNIKNKKNIGLKKGLFVILFLGIFLIGLNSVMATGYSDNFDGGNQTAWIVVNGGDNSTYEFQNNRYKLHTESGSGLAKSLGSYVNTAFTDSIAQTRIQKINPSDNFLSYILLRVTPVTMSGYVCGASSDDHVWFGKLTGGIYVSVTSSGTVPSYNSSDFHLKCAVIGNKLFAKVWNYSTAEPLGWQINATDSSYLSGVEGIMLATYPTLDWDNVSVAFDDFNVTDKSIIYVDDDWAGNATDTEVELGKIIGYNAFATIQEGINNVSVGGTVNIAAGTYNESQVLIEKALTLEGAGIDISIIDGNNANLSSKGLVRILAAGNVSVNGFTIRNAGGPPWIGGDNGDNKENYGMWVASNSSNALYNISYVKIIGQVATYPNDDYDYGLRSDSGKEKLIFTHSVITETGANSIIMAQHTGETEISYNALDTHQEAAGPIYYMSMNNVNITTQQKIDNNIINISLRAGTWTLLDSAISFQGSWTASMPGTTFGRFDNVIITGNNITGVCGNRRGISIDNIANEGIKGEISVIIQNNNIIGTGDTSKTSHFGIRLLGKVNSNGVTNNTITGVAKGITILNSPFNSDLPSIANINYNSITNSSYCGIYWSGTTSLNATHNYWGSALDSVVNSSILGNVTYHPYYIDEEMTQLATKGEEEEGNITLDPEKPYAVIKNSTNEVIITIENETVKPMIDFSYIIDNGTVESPNITITSSIAQINIPATNITSENSSWNGVLSAPIVTTITLPSVSGETRTLSSAIELGLSDTKISFNNAVRILLPGEKDKRVGYSRTGSSFTEITNVCEGDNQTWADSNLTADSECKMNVGNDLVVLTKHFTTFATFSSAPVVSIDSNPNSGGGGGSSCTYDTNYNWACSAWSKCIDGKQTRECNKYNNCGNVYGKPETEKTCVSNPAQLFDIKLELESAIIDNANELSSVITFESFGNVPTPVDLTYSILDSSGMEVYSEKGNITVTTEEILRNNFENLNLPEGKYTLILTTVYGNNVKDEFRQDFEVGKEEVLQNIKNNWIFFVIVGGAIIILIIAFIIFLKKKNKAKRT